MTPKEMIADVRAECNTPSTQGRVTDTEIMLYLNRAKDLICTKIIEADVKHFESNANISFVADQEEYDIPRIFWQGKVSLVERYDSAGTFVKTVEPMARFQDKEHYSAVANSVSSEQAGDSYYIRGRKIGFKPKPASALTNAVKVYGIQLPHDMFWGTLGTGVADPTVSTFILDGGAVLAGRVSDETGYYTNAVVRVLSGTSGRGLERTITAYNAFTKTATIDTNWTIDDVKTQTYCIMGAWPEPYHHLAVSYAVYKVSAKPPSDEKLARLKRQEWMEGWKQLEDTISPRQVQENEHVHVPWDDDF